MVRSTLWEVTKGYFMLLL